MRKLSAALLASLAACGALTGAALADPPAVGGNSPAAGATSQVILGGGPPPANADPTALAAISRANDQLSMAESTGSFSDFDKSFRRLTTPDFDFNTPRRVTYDRSRYLTDKREVMADKATVSKDTWTVTSATKSTVDASVNATAERNYAASVVDTAGFYGAKGMTHQIVSHVTYWEHWIQPTSGASWVMDDMDVLSNHETVDGKVFNPAPKAPKHVKKTKPVKPRIIYRNRYRLYRRGGQIHTF